MKMTRSKSYQKRPETVSEEKLKLINKTDATLVKYFASGKICSSTKDLKLQIIDNHFQKCCKIQTCGWCKNYFSLLTYHTRNRCTNDFNCAIPYCLQIKQKLSSLKEVILQIFLKITVFNINFLILATNFEPRKSDTNIELKLRSLKISKPIYF